MIGQLINLTELWIDGNRIRRISSNIGNLKKLTHFEGSNNLLTSLPNEIGQWCKLEVLSLTDNELESLPETLGQLKSLITLKIDENQLQEIPKTISQLNNLEEVMLSHNDLIELPSTIGLLRKLKILTCDENLLHSLPNELTSCKSLRILSLRGNKLQHLPSNLGHLINLRVLNIVNNYINVLPVSLLNLTQLSALWISDNQAEPLVKLQKELNTIDDSTFLTCFMLPQTQAKQLQQNIIHSSKTHENNNGGSSRNENSKRRHICFDSKQNSISSTNSVEQQTRLMRSPTPYPKELRVLAKYAKNIQKTSAAAGLNAGLNVAEPGNNQMQPPQHIINKTPETTIKSVEIKEARVQQNVPLLQQQNEDMHNGNYHYYSQQNSLQQPNNITGGMEMQPHQTHLYNINHNENQYHQLTPYQLQAQQLYNQQHSHFQQTYQNQNGFE